MGNFVYMMDAGYFWSTNDVLYECGRVLLRSFKTSTCHRFLGSLAKFWDIITISSIEWIKISIKNITTQLIIMSLSPPEASYKLLWTNVQYRFSYIYWLLGRLQILSFADINLAFLLASNHYHNFLNLSFCVMLVCRSNGMVNAFFLCYMFPVIIVIVAIVAIVMDMFAPHEKLWQWVWGPSQ